MAKKFVVDIDMSDQDILNVLTGILFPADQSVLPTDSVRTAIGKLQGQLDVWNEEITTSAYTNSSGSALVTVAQLPIPVTAGKTYRIECQLPYQSQASNRGIVATIGSADAAGTIVAVANMLQNTDGTGALHSGAITSLGDLVTTTAVQAANTDYLCQLVGLFRCTTSGTLYPQFRSSTNGNLITVSAGANILIREF